MFGNLKLWAATFRAREVQQKIRELEDEVRRLKIANRILLDDQAATYESLVSYVFNSHAPSKN